jgi:hypothetical protein
MRHAIIALAALGLFFYSHHVLAQSRTTTAIIKETTPNHWLVLNSDGSSHLVIYNPLSGFYLDSTISTGSQQDVAPPPRCGYDQDGLYFCQ